MLILLYDQLLSEKILLDAAGCYQMHLAGLVRCSGRGEGDPHPGWTLEGELLLALQCVSAFLDTFNPEVLT